MPLARRCSAAALGAVLFAWLSAPAAAAHSVATEAAEVPAGADLAPAAQSAPAPAPAPQAAPAPAAAPPFAFAKPVFDETWATIGLGVGLVPSYIGSDNYIAFPLPLIAGRVGGVGISPNGPGFVLDLNSARPALAPARGPRLAIGPAFRFRNDRNAQIEDAVVARAGRLDVALEAGVNVALAWRGVARPLDQLSLGVQARWDVLGAHEGMVIEPQIAYRTPIGRAVSLQVQIGAEFVDDDFAAYYFTLTPAQAAASGLSAFRAEGGLARIGAFSILSYDLDRNLLNGGWSLTMLGGYSRLIGDAADTPFTAARGDANQFLLGLGAAYTF